MLRGALGISLGLCLVAALTTYGGVGVNLLMMVARAEVPTGSAYAYLITAWFCVAMVLVLIAMAILTLSEFSSWKLRQYKFLAYGVCFLLLILALVHFVVFSGFGHLEDSELNNLFIDGSIFYAWLTLLMIGLFLITRRLRPDIGLHSMRSEHLS